MKRIIFLLSVLFVSSYLEAAVGGQGGTRPVIWRSSTTATADVNVFIASDTIQFHKVVISSPAVNSWVEVYNASTATTATTPFTRIDLSNNATPDMEYDVQFSSGLTYEKFGSAVITILWDWVISPTRGREAVGR